MKKHRIQLARERAGLSVGQAARILGLERDDILSLEIAEDPDPDHLERMADAYGVNLPWMMGEIPQYDYDRLNDLPAADRLEDHDRKIAAEFIASLPQRPEHPESWLDCEDCVALSKSGAKPPRCGRFLERKVQG